MMVDSAGALNGAAAAEAALGGKMGMNCRYNFTFAVNGRPPFGIHCVVVAGVAVVHAAAALIAAADGVQTLPSAASFPSVC